MSLGGLRSPAGSLFVAGTGGAVGGGLGAFPHVLRHGALPRIAARGHSGRRHRADRLAASVQLSRRRSRLRRPWPSPPCCPSARPSPCGPPSAGSREAGADQRHRSWPTSTPSTDADEHRQVFAPRLPHRALRGPRRLRPRAHAHPLHTNGHRERRRGCPRPRAGAGWGGGGHRRYPHRPGHDEREDPLHAAAVLRRHHAVSHGGRLAGAGAASLGVPDEHRPLCREPGGQLVLRPVHVDHDRCPLPAFLRHSGAYLRARSAPAGPRLPGGASARPLRPTGGRPYACDRIRLHARGGAGGVRGRWAVFNERVLMETMDIRPWSAANASRTSAASSSSATACRNARARS